VSTRKLPTCVHSPTGKRALCRRPASTSAPLPGPEEAPAGAPSARAAIHDAALGELETETGALTDAERCVPDLLWLDAFDSLGAEGRTSMTVTAARAAVEKLLATL